MQAISVAFVKLRCQMKIGVSSFFPMLLCYSPRSSIHANIGYKCPRGSISTCSWTSDRAASFPGSYGIQALPALSFDRRRRWLALSSSIPPCLHGLCERVWLNPYYLIFFNCFSKDFILSLQNVRVSSALDIFVFTVVSIISIVHIL